MSEKNFLNLLWYDGKTYKIPISQTPYWFYDKRGSSHCTVLCQNESSVFYITDRGFAHIAYCEPDAVNRILKVMLTGQLERGIWCVIDQSRLRPHEYYKRYMEYMKKINPKQARKLQKKIEIIRKLVYSVKGVKRAQRTKKGKRSA